MGRPGQGSHLLDAPGWDPRHPWLCVVDDGKTVAQFCFRYRTAVILLFPHTSCQDEKYSHPLLLPRPKEVCGRYKPERSSCQTAPGLPFFLLVVSTYPASTESEAIQKKIELPFLSILSKGFHNRRISRQASNRGEATANVPLIDNTCS